MLVFITIKLVFCLILSKDFLKPDVHFTDQTLNPKHSNALFIVPIV